MFNKMYFHILQFRYKQTLKILWLENDVILKFSTMIYLILSQSVIVMISYYTHLSLNLLSVSSITVLFIFSQECSKCYSETNCIGREIIEFIVFTMAFLQILTQNCLGKTQRVFLVNFYLKFR